MKHRFESSRADFKCIHCHYLVSADMTVSGVHNRNHCPYCLWSRHLDLYQAGDRLCACKSKMQPVGLTLKRMNKKYGHAQQGELMLIHFCIECGEISINRIAADDDADTIFTIFQNSLRLEPAVHNAIQRNGVQALHNADAGIVRARLFGWSSMPLPEAALS